MLVGAAVGIAAFAALDRFAYQPPLVRGDSRARPLETAIADIRADELLTVLRRDAIAAIFEPTHVPASEAQLRPADRVIGVVVGVEARAYPVAILSAHEVVNDRIAGEPYAVTW